MQTVLTDVHKAALQKTSTTAEDISYHQLGLAKALACQASILPTQKPLRWVFTGPTPTQCTLLACQPLQKLAPKNLQTNSASLLSSQ